jgi:hypothetical protein
MPQPLKRNKHFQLTAGALAMRPKLAAQIATIAALWSGTEAYHGIILAKVLQWEPTAGAAMYVAITSSVAQRTALLEAASIKLPAERCTELQDILVEANARAKERNTIVHGIWGFSDNYPNALLHCSVKNMIMQQSRAEALESVRKRGFASMAHVDAFAIEYEKNERPEGLTVYTQRDFSAVIKRLENLNKRLLQFIREFDPSWEILDQIQKRAAEQSSRPRE